jgi:ketosteroid isomerase-like protein
MNPSPSEDIDSTETPDLENLLARYQQAWAEGDIDAIVSMTLEDGVYEASFGPDVWGERFVGPEAIRAKLVDMGIDQPGRARHQYGETHVVGDCGFALWTNVEDGPDGPRVTMHGADFYRFRDGKVAAKIAYRKAIRS